MSFPPGEFFIRNFATGLVLDVADNGTRPGSRVIVWDRKSSGVENQLWRYEDGFLVNVASRLVLEVPGYEGGGDIAPGTLLIVNVRRSRPENLNQLWANNEGSLMPYDPKVAVSAHGGAGSLAVVDTYYRDDPSKLWNFDSV